MEQISTKSGDRTL